MNLVPVGVKGEMYVAGRDLARGYLQRPEFTAQMFVPNPFSTVPGDRLFKTNRQARWRKDGTIDDLGSLTGGITLWGNRLSLQQMREALLESRYVKDAVITLKPGPDGEPRLAGYIIPGETADDLNADLRQHLGSIFPEYMIPDKFIALEKFPLAPDGSVDVHALPLPEHDAADSEALLRDEIEIRLAAIWKDLLKISRAGRTQSFFELGGHSLLAITLIRKIKEEFNQDLPLSTLFEHATIEYLGNVLRQKHQASRTSNLVPIQPKGTRPPLFFVHPLSGNALQYLTLANLLGKDQPFYGLQSVDEEENSCQPYLSIEERASRYIHAVRKIQPTCPYFIGGWSFGGYIAYEMAQQLHSQNHEVAGLILLDIIAHTPEQETRVPDDAEFLLHFASSNRLRFATIDRQMEQSLAGLTLDAVRNQKPADRLRYLIDQLVNIGVLPPETEISQIQQFIQSVRKREKSLTCSKLHSYGGPVTLVRAAETNPTHSELDAADTSLGFSQLCPGLKVQFSPGNHFNMVYPPHVTGLAQIVKEWIEASSAVLV